ncbi:MULTISPECIES: S-layer homology domain-containing protein [unclassified Fusibacter]|uniref:S-layer homology domain-containing protein n=1 Tax=unclassified Fusibacter TaxID=2624464 RepID=UPI0013E9810A|nr:MULTISPECIES: S-layer homology domain-containing protein [unclassified Fusibacter]MCK8060970.1 S-layer homology domain-containing protein [Fusibacter sp. A2]NPE20576.1 S-layer homology domain-containing protein [Fusibacter sp. A1]
MKRQQIVLVLLVVLMVTLLPFADGSEKTYGYHLKELGIINGDANGDLREEDPITREEFMKILMKIAIYESIPELPETPTFSDVAKDRWSYKYIEAVNHLGLTSGTGGGKFSPTAKLTYQQVCKFLVNNVGYEVDYANASSIAKYKHKIYSLEGETAPVLKRKHVFEMVSRSIFSIAPGRGYVGGVLNIDQYSKFNALDQLVNHMIESDLKAMGKTVETKGELLKYDLQEHDYFQPIYIQTYEQLLKNQITYEEISHEALFDLVSYSEKNAGSDSSSFQFYGFVENNDPDILSEDVAFDLWINRYYKNPAAYISDEYGLHLSMVTMRDIYKGSSFEHIDLKGNKSTLRPILINLVAYNWYNTIGDHRPMQILGFIDENNLPTRWHLLTGDTITTEEGVGFNAKGTSRNQLPQKIDENGFDVRDGNFTYEESETRFGFSDVLKNKYGSLVKTFKKNSKYHEVFDFVQADVDYAQNFSFEFRIYVNADDEQYEIEFGRLMLTKEGKEALLEAVNDLPIMTKEKEILIQFINEEVKFSALLDNGYTHGNMVGIPSELKYFNFITKRIDW